MSELQNNLFALYMCAMWAQHPLLVRSTYTDAKVAELARLAHQKCALDGTRLSCHVTLLITTDQSQTSKA